MGEGARTIAGSLWKTRGVHALRCTLSYAGRRAPVQACTQPKTTKAAQREPGRARDYIDLEPTNPEGSSSYPYFRQADPRLPTPCLPPKPNPPALGYIPGRFEPCS